MYKVTTGQVVFTSTIYIIGMIVPSIAILPIIKQYGTSNTLKTAMIIAFIGCGVRLLSDDWFNYLLIGQFLLGAATCLVINSLMQFTFLWFSPQSRPVVLALCSIVNIFGGGLGNSLSLIFLSNTETNLNIIHSKFYEFNFIMFGLVGGLMVITLVFFRERPPEGYGHQVIEDKHKGRRSSITKEEVELNSISNSNFLQQNYRYLRYALTFPIFRVYMLISIISNAALIYMDSIVNILLTRFGFSSVN